MWKEIFLQVHFCRRSIAFKIIERCHPEPERNHSCDLKRKELRPRSRSKTLTKTNVTLEIPAAAARSDGTVGCVKNK